MTIRIFPFISITGSASHTYTLDTHAIANITPNDVDVDDEKRYHGMCYDLQAPMSHKFSNPFITRTISLHPMHRLMVYLCSVLFLRKLSPIKPGLQFNLFGY